MSIANIIAASIFGLIGFVVFVYGKKQSSLKSMIIGAILMVYPYFVSNFIVNYIIGLGLVILLFIFR